MADEPGHVPVLVAEVVAALRPEQGGVFVDCTLGLGGHTRALLEAGAGRVIGIDRDLSALAVARMQLGELAGQVEMVHADYRRLGDVLVVRECAHRQNVRSRNRPHAPRLPWRRLQLR